MFFLEPEIRALNEGSGEAIHSHHCQSSWPLYNFLFRISGACSLKEASSSYEARIGMGPRMPDVVESFGAATNILPSSAHLVANIETATEMDQYLLACCPIRHVTD